MFALQIGRVTNRLSHSEMEHLNWQTSGSITLWGRVYIKYSWARKWHHRRCCPVENTNS